METHAQQVLQEFISDLTEETKSYRYQKKPSSFKQLTFNYKQTNFQSDRLKNLFEIIQMLFQIGLEEKQICESLIKMEQCGVEEIGQFQYYGPKQLKELGLDQQQIQRLRDFLDNQIPGYDDQIQQLSNISSQRTDALTQEAITLRQNCRFLGQQKGLNLYQYPIFKKEEILDLENYRTVIVLGETGTGKTTFINYFLNFYLCVQLKDDFRYQLIQENKNQSEAISRTQNVTIYYIKPFQGKYGIRIIDTPGYFDTRGVEQDKRITQQIQYCFQKEVDTLSTICFLMRSQTMRLTPCQNYILTSILQMFGKDIIQNFVFIFTFYDGSAEPQGIKSLRFAGDINHSESPVKDLIDQINQPWYMKLNNVSMDDDRQTQITQIYWELANKCFKDLYVIKIIQNKQQSLYLTRQVIDKRGQIQILVQSIRVVIKQQLDEITNIKVIQNHIQQLDLQIQGSKNFTVKQKRSSIQKVDIEQGTYTTNCIICNHTCHYPCALPKDEQKINCTAMTDGKCRICKGKCEWNQHSNMSFILKYKEEETFIELTELKNLYKSGIQIKEMKSKIIDEYEKKLTNLQAECMKQQIDLRQLLDELKKISLQPPVCKHQEQFADVMIQQEQENQLYGYKERITALKEMKEFWKTIRETYTQSGDSKITEEFLQIHLTRWKMQNGKRK